MQQEESIRLPIVLASASPRRRELLAQIGLDFTVQPAEGEEVITGTRPEQIVKELADQKARQVAAQQQKPCLVIGADTIVACDGRILGKPADEAHALEMLTLLQGRTHSVFTGVAVYVARPETGLRQTALFAEETKVHMYPASREELISYIATGEPMDKAGAYAIQGLSAVLIRSIEGDYNNVVGLPVARLYQHIKAYCTWPEAR